MCYTRPIVLPSAFDVPNRYSVKDFLIICSIYICEYYTRLLLLHELVIMFPSARFSPTTLLSSSSCIIFGGDPALWMILSYLVNSQPTSPSLQPRSHSISSWVGCRLNIEPMRAISFKKPSRQYNAITSVLYSHIPGILRNTTMIHYRFILTHHFRSRWRSMIKVSSVPGTIRYTYSFSIL